MFRSMQAPVLTLIAALAAMPAAAEDAPATAAAVERSVFVYDFELENTSLDATSPEEFARLAAIGDRLRQLYDADPGWRLVTDAATVAKGREANLQSCGGCDVTMGRTTGAEVVVTGVVQKVSNLILAITIYARSAETGELVGMAGADIRGNTDETWMHGMNWLAKNRLRLAVLKK